ncbi:MAG: PH domain-containing protein [Methyloceanibacter sp.]
MSYIKHVLPSGETIRYQGSVHWILYLPAIVLALVAAAIAAVNLMVSWRYGWVFAAACLLFALLLALRAWFIRWMTEIAITDRRVIYARGFIQRHSVEVHMDKIKSVDVDQTVLGRLFDYGDVTIHGTGTTLEPLRDVDRPIAFRNEVTAH